MKFISSRYIFYSLSELGNLVGMKDINYSFYDFSDICCFFLTNDCQVCARELNREDSISRLDVGNSTPQPQQAGHSYFGVAPLCSRTRVSFGKQQMAPAFILMLLYSVAISMVLQEFQFHESWLQFHPVISKNTNHILELALNLPVGYLKKLKLSKNLYTL